MPRDDNLIQKTYRLPKWQTDFIEALAADGMFGKEADAVRELLGRAIKEMIDSEHIRKYKESIKLLGEKE